MSISGGANRGDFRPAAPEKDSVRGTHQGEFSFLNVHDAQPGYVYYWERKHRGKLLRRHREGWRPIQEGDPEHKGSDLPADYGHALDTGESAGDVVLMRIPIKEYRELNERRSALREASRGGTTESKYLNDGAKAQSLVGSRAQGRALYHRRGDHGTSDQ